MNDKLKIVAAVVCIVLAIAFIALRKNGDKGGLDSLKGQIVYTKCLECGDVAEVDAVEYFKEVEDKTTLQNAQPLLTCTKCGKNAVTEAIKCDNCGDIFVPKDKYGNYDDKCPKCGYSKRESLRAKKSQ